MKDFVGLYVYAYDNVAMYVTSNKEELINYLDDEFIIIKDDLPNGYDSTLGEVNDLIQGINKELHQLRYIVSDIEL